eukprot:CAMPEP_0195118664 /NCGR_PEP_ID=MMETSP0448-20130528/117556_1 /TAXON_ID=66468 /ORGANISM="Heterocapsa triquestra, Strain CCMP 448" /LENGTH=145 /DNA_ID=CAMNT_0040155941 /DNA_START=18 /DNA_END=452 /DNA_ORIENTATION=-
MAAKRRNQSPAPCMLTSNQLHGATKVQRLANIHSSSTAPKFPNAVATGKRAARESELASRGCSIAAETGPAITAKLAANRNHVLHKPLPCHGPAGVLAGRPTRCGGFPGSWQTLWQLWLRQHWCTSGRRSGLPADGLAVALALAA